MLWLAGLPTAGLLSGTSPSALDGVSPRKVLAEFCLIIGAFPLYHSMHPHMMSFELHSTGGFRCSGRNPPGAWRSGVNLDEESEGDRAPWIPIVLMNVYPLLPPFLARPGRVQYPYCLADFQYDLILV